MLVTGGWLAPGGKRVVFVVLPRRGSQPNPVQLEFRWYEVPEDVFVRLEKHSLRAEPQDSITKNIWIPESTQAILDIFERTDGVAPRSKGPLAIMSGNSGQISDEISQTIGAIGVGEKYLINTTFDWVPKISPDGQLIELTLNVQQDVKRVPSP